MRPFLIISLIFLTTSLFGQKGDSIDIVFKTLRNATFKNSVKILKVLPFSNSENKDTFLLIVPSGLLSETQSQLKIKRFDGKIIFTETFQTSYFIKDIFQPDTVPQTGGQEGYEKYMTKYITSITRTQFEKFATKKINKFFDDIKVKNSKLKEIKTYGDIKDKVLFKEVSLNPNAKIIWLPCFECDEGVRYLAYSTKKEKAIIFLESD